MMTVLRAPDLQDAHPHLPDDWKSSMAAVRLEGGPWPCDSCRGPSMISYRCSKCGHDLAGEGSTAGRQGVQR